MYNATILYKKLYFNVGTELFVKNNKGKTNRLGSLLSDDNREQLLI